MYQETETTEIMNPREWNENLGTMLCFHRRYILGDKNPYNSEHYTGWNDFAKSLFKVHDVAIMLPIYMYDHSGISISHTPFSCPWDSGRIGFIFVSKDKLRKEYGVKRITASLVDKATRILEAEVKEYNQYLNQ
jgi:hypothetical protein